MEEEDAALARQHKREKIELQAKIQSLKNAVPKSDKKRRQQLMEDVAKLEAELEEKHSKELATLTEVSSVANGVTNLNLGAEVSTQQPRVSKAQKRREKKAALEKERDDRIAEAEVENLSGARHLENQKLTQILSERLLQIKHIPSDGHCMYKAIEHQLKYREASATLSSLRQQTEDYMQSHAEDLLPFLTNPTTGDMYTLEEFEKYCSETANTPAWGGQLELRALSHILKTPIEVIQADSSPIVVGEEHSGDPITVVYTHAYGLREHYNSVEPLNATPTD
ncbi:LOW QUALITY PROTEIN: deubiquitinase OTUD6B-like [Gastrophryne carolinensis]